MTQAVASLRTRLRAPATLADGLRDDLPSRGALQRSLQAMLLRDPFLQAAYVTNANGQVVEAALSAQSGRYAADAVGLDLARIESGRLSVNIAPVELGPLLQQVEHMVQSQMCPHGVTRTVVVAGHPGAAAPPVLADGASVRLSVSDTGRGMTADQLAHLYEPFNRLGQERGNVEGTGISLVITRHLVGMMHGQPDVQSTPGVGSTFAITLPASGASQSLARPDEATADAAPPRTVLGRVVYIEDNEVNAQLMRAILRQRPQVDLQVRALAASGLTRQA